MLARRLLEVLAVDYGRLPLAGARRVEAIELESVDQEEAAIAEVLVAASTDLGPQAVERQPRIGRGDHRDVTPPLHLEEPDGDPDRVLMGPNCGQIHDSLQHLDPPERVFSGIEQGRGGVARLA